MLMTCSTCRAHQRMHRRALCFRGKMSSVSAVTATTAVPNSMACRPTRDLHVQPEHVQGSDLVPYCHPWCGFSHTTLHTAGYSLQPTSQAESLRLGAVLAAFPTTQAQDQALLEAGLDDAGGQADWQTRRILEFRVERKRALRYVQRLPFRLREWRVAVGGCLLRDHGSLCALAV